MSFNDFHQKYKLKIKTTSNIKVYQVLSSIRLDNVGIYLTDGPFLSDFGIVNLHPVKGSHWFCYLHENCSDCYGCVPPKKLYIFIIKKEGIVFNLNIKFKKMIVFVQVTVCI